MPKAAFWAIFTACLIAMVIIDANLRAIAVRPVAAPPERGSHWDPEIFSILSFGQVTAAIDSIWLDALMDDRITKVPRWTHAKVYYDLDLITQIDPAFFEAYHAGANLLAVVRDDIFGAKALIVRGNDYRKNQLPTRSEDFQKRFWPNSWAVPMLGGYIELFEEANMPRAAYFFKEAGESSNAPPFLQDMQKRLSRPGGEYEVGIKLLTYMAKAAPTDDVRNELVEKRHSLMVNQFLYDVNRGFDEFLSKDHKYRAQASVNPAQMQKYWREFLKSVHSSERDPWGGRLVADQGGRINTTTPHQKVFGLDGGI